MIEPRGTLRATASVHFGRHCVIPTLTELLGRYPRLQLDLSLTDRFADLAEDGFDLAVRTGEPVAQAGMVGRRVARQRMIVCASPMNLEAQGYPLAIGDISLHRGVVYLRSGMVPPWQFPAANGLAHCNAPCRSTTNGWFGRDRRGCDAWGPDSRGSPPGSYVPA
ncbi:LysR substrate-binding domain-containing protein [Pseudomonas saxonica]|uniref:LysR substrate-binding domain-containing protein n=1 Tax=Pseudomonas saxonica TaxID=2600598 RepID=UPI002D7805DB|nr:LysR substrate-binding domain-containing protein [Pseudomonas saxonica]WRQ73545.1 LysR substrate-binding domain-containing protein [Pseudomonas saxonica]